MVASGAGHLPVADLLLETHRSNVNEEDSRVSVWEVMGGISEQLPYAIIDTLTYATGIGIIEYYVLYSIRTARILHIKCFVTSLPV